MYPIYLSHGKTYYIPMYHSSLPHLLDKYIFPVAAHLSLDHITWEFNNIEFRKRADYFIYDSSNDWDETIDMVLPFVSSEMEPNVYRLTNQDMYDLILNIKFPFSRICLKTLQNIEVKMEMDRKTRISLKYNMKHVGFLQTRPPRTQLSCDKFVIANISMLQYSSIVNK